MTARAIMAFVLQFGVVRLLLSCGLAVIRVLGEYRPDDPRRLVRHRNGSEADRFALKKLHDPRVHTFWVPTGTLNLRGHADHEQSSDIAITFLADPTQTLFATT